MASTTEATCRPRPNDSKDVAAGVSGGASSTGGGGAQNSDDCTFQTECDERRKLNEMQPSDFEIGFYLVSFAAALAYAAHDFYMQYGREPVPEFYTEYMEPGWLSDWMEPNDQLERRLLRHHRFLIVTSIGFLLVSQLTLRKTSITTHYLATAAYTLAVTAAAVNIRSAVYMLLLHCGAVCIGFFSLTGVWLLVLAVMMLMNSEYYMLLLNTLDLHGVSLAMFFPITGYLYCRSISAGHSLNRIVQQQRLQGSAPTLRQLLCLHLPRSLAYGFYLPNHYVGPILTFDDFCNEMEKPERTVWDLRSAVAVVWRACRLLLWLLLLQALHHFLPVGAFLHSLQPGDFVPYKRLVLAMYMHGQNFMLLYVQLYGWAGLLARIDGVQLPHWPDCISRVYTYRRMWRVFDRGLATFMHHHIYLPLGGSRHGRLWQLTGVTASFAFVSIYHGDSWEIRAWSALNAGQLLLEVAASKVYMARVKTWLSWYLSPRNHQRVVAFIIGWNLLLTSCFIFLFLVQHNALFFLTEVFKPLVLLRPFWHLALVLYLSYCIVQVSLRYERNECKQKKS